MLCHHGEQQNVLDQSVYSYPRCIAELPREVADFLVALRRAQVGGLYMVIDNLDHWGVVGEEESRQCGASQGRRTTRLQQSKSCYIENL